MKKTILIVTSLLLAFSSANAQWWSKDKVKGNGEVITKSRSVGDYDGVQLVGSMNVVLVSGNEGNLKIEAESNLQEYIKTEVKNNVLKISTDDDVNIHPTKEIKITVPFRDIHEVSITGSGDIWNDDVIKANNFKMQVTGSGDILLNVDVNDLKGQITGSGDIKLKGRAQDLECKVTGSGDFKAFDLKAENVEAKISGSGDIQVTATESLKASVGGSGDVVYKGNPKKEDFNTSGSGSVSSY
ncbi:DUF2807 domain-containing protein [Christiangramia fulva]|uniref:DUF2807 domain-containing protein n=1 Tax=Christiangramia fulva TaxID=2126553 RepID=A0A2R3Z8W3_9FLAO|nr:head GIN domain-containing protein [Christiangramia fulva]AVR46718.1 DUF2807 domain-containing protein [Christiangramia fulva]